MCLPDALEPVSLPETWPWPARRRRSGGVLVRRVVELMNNSIERSDHDLSPSDVAVSLQAFGRIRCCVRRARAALR